MEINRHHRVPYVYTNFIILCHICVCICLYDVSYQFIAGMATTKHQSDIIVVIRGENCGAEEQVDDDGLTSPPPTSSFMLCLCHSPPSSSLCTISSFSGKVTSLQVFRPMKVVITARVLDNRHRFQFTLIISHLLFSFLYLPQFLCSLK